MVATSVGITARVLSDINRLDTSEGVTILAGAVIDDVLGILVLAIVNAIAIVELAGGTLDVNTIITIAVKAVLFWLGLTGIGILASKQIEKGLKWFKTKGATFGLGLALAFACAATAELFGLAMIIGAYSIGLALSDTKVAHFLEEQLKSVYNFVVPIFFVVMGMMVDFNQMLPLLWPYGVVISFFAIISKVFGCGIPALFVGFNLRGAYRVGLGMLPPRRGRVDHRGSRYRQRRHPDRHVRRGNPTDTGHHADGPADVGTRLQEGWRGHARRDQGESRAAAR